MARQCPVCGKAFMRCSCDLRDVIMAFVAKDEAVCPHIYEGPHGVEMIRSPSGKEWAIGGTDHEDRWKRDPWCGKRIPNPDKED